MVFPLVAVTWDTSFIILGVQNLSFGRPGASILYAGGHFVSLGTPERTMEGHMGVQNPIFSDFGRFWLILGARFESFLVSDGLNSLFFLSLFPGNCLHRFLGGIIDSWSS